MRVIRLSFVLVLIASLLVINLLYFVNTRETLINNQAEKVNVVVDNMVNSIESTKKSETYFNEFMAKELRTASIAIQNALPPNVEDVRNEDLVALTDKLGLQGITLFIEKDNDVIGVKSNLPEQIGLKTRSWADGMWYDMFKQLLTKHNVELIPGFGQSLENFWSGPIDTSSANPKMISKWGYYNDGTTDYLINPFMDDGTMSRYKDEVGVNELIRDAEEERDFILDVSVINSNALINGEKTTRDTGVVWLSDKMKVYGDYEYQSKADKNAVEVAIEENHPVRRTIDDGSKTLLKFYQPVPFKNGDNLQDELVIVVATDYELIQDELNDRFIRQFIASVIVFLIAFTMVYFLILIITKRERTIFNVQEIYTEQIQSLFKRVREQRHDANHHLYTISGLLKIEAYEEAVRYVDTLTSLEEPTNELISVSIPAFAGLLQAKLAEANEKGIEMELHFNDMDNLDLKLEKITDMVIATGNIIDNAFHAVLETPIVQHKKVGVFGSYKKKELTLSISNNGAPISSDDLSKIFSYGFSSRKDKGGTGIGLASSMKSLERHGGSITVTSNEELTEFVIKIPVSSKEILKS